MLEYEEIKKMGGYVIKIIRDTGLIDNHVSENFDIDIPVIVKNNGSKEDLFRQIVYLIN